MQSLSSVLQANRRRYFVGREQELALLDAMLSGSDTQSRLLYLYGPGGIGKSTLLAECKARVAEAEQPVIDLNGYYLQPVSTQIEAEIRQSLAALAVDEQPVWLFIDNFDQLAAMEGWFHEVFLPQLPVNVYMVLAGRQPPVMNWRLDPAWSGLMHCLELPPLSREATETYLQRRGLDGELRERIMDFARGYPLALAMSTDICQAKGHHEFNKTDHEDLFQALALHFIEEARTTRHATALQAAALSRTLTEPLLAAMLPGENVQELYNWLAGLSCVSGSERGLVVHDVIAEVIAADLRCRDPDKAERLIYLGEEYFLTQLNSDTSTATHDIIFDITYLARQGELSNELHQAARELPVHIDKPASQDVKLVRDLIEHYQGEQQRAHFDNWHARQPDGLVIFRNSENRLQGFGFFIEISPQEDLSSLSDPVVTAINKYARSLDIGRVGTVEVCRFWMDCERHMQMSSVMTNVLTLLMSRAAQHTDIEASGVVLLDNELARNMAEVAEHHYLTEATYDMGDERVIVTMHDWRDELIGNWLVRTNRRVRGMMKDARRLESPTLTQEQIRRSLKSILRNFQHADALKQSPLLKSSLFPADLIADERVERLRQLIQTAAERLQQAPKTERYYNILFHTYFRPATSRLGAADKLNMAPSTYYRHLATAVDLLAGELATMQQDREFDN
ncbi:SpoVK/Ycf46/Vps4 family AAA+-type ATPase [Methylohalomonas lacus]|uniref:SpoVK/Ycf46/Vps4 family AAA+-type ATPase n=1 Tax=Methylohalomonas lacus TaxID=398773 RepID=A0AAE3HMT8_9GAMM|nr:ATP-binding protein [Methylohalomonas lacus]MCS3903358.1 SpoVK/Ycf46/Vps4 family AAA+-type ATPase [Methylohalomonas lacus]